MAFFRKDLSESTQACFSCGVRFNKTIKNTHFIFGPELIIGAEGEPCEPRRGDGTGSEWSSLGAALGGAGGHQP